MKQFKLPIEQSESPHFDIVPPPEYTHITVPFQYNYSHNVYSSTPAESRDGPARELAPTAVSSSHSSSASSPATSDEDYTSRRRRRGRRLSATGWDDKGWGHLIRYDEFPAPTGPKPEALAFFDAPRQRSQQLRREVQATIEALRKILEERPIWTRRGIINRLLEREAATARTVSAGGPHTSARHGPLDPGAAPGGRPGDREARLWGLVKLASRYVAYQFISGPFRDAIVKFGVDPRTDPKYRVYQTLCFKFRFSRDGGGASSLPEDDGVGGGQQSWREFNRAHTSLLERGEQVWMGDYNDRSGGDAAGGADGSNNHFNSHIFDGRRFSASSKLWQVCDVTDPVLAGLFESAAVRPASAPDLAVAGWYTRPLWAHAKAIMKTRIVAIQFGLAATQAPDWAFAAVVESARQWDRKAMDAILAAVHDAGGERVGGNDGYAATATPSGASHGTRPSAPPIGDAGWPGHVTGLPALNLTPAQQAELSGRSTVRRRHGGDGGGGGGDGDGGGNGRPPAAVAARKWRAVGSNKRSRPLETVSMAGLFAPTGASDAAASDTTAAFRAAKGVRTAGEGKGKEVAAEPDTAGPAVGASSGEARQLATRQVRFASLDDADEIMEEDMEDEPDEAASGGDSTSDYDEEEMESEIARFGRRGHDFGDEEDVDEEDNENEDNMDSSDEKTPAGYPLQDDMSDVDEDYDE